MKIVGKNRDYYDGVGMYDGEGRLWVRKTETVHVDRARLWQTSRSALEALEAMPVPSWQFRDAADRTLVCFCGRGYGFVRFCGSTDLEKALTLKNAARVAGEGDRPSPRTTSAFKAMLAEEPGAYAQYPFNRLGWSRWLDRFDGMEIGDELHRELDTPVFALQLSAGRHWLRPERWEPTIIKNPLLRELGMPSRVDPYTAWQEIDMYLGMQLAKQEDPADAFSDDIKRQAKGFGKRSFTRRPGTHPNRKRKKKKS